MQEHALFIQELYKVTKLDLRRVLNKYYSQFLLPERVTVMATVTGTSNEEIRSSFNDPTLDSRFKVDFKIRELSEFQI